jgi:hypothetical protein
VSDGQPEQLPQAPEGSATAPDGGPTDDTGGDIPAFTPRRRAPEEDPDRRPVAFLLAAAAGLAAILAMWAAFLSDEAAGARQSALRSELQRAAVLLMDVRQVYGSEGAQAFSIAARETLADQMRARARVEPDAVARTLEAEADVQMAIVEQVKPATELTAGGYELAGGGYDLVARLVHYRRAAPDIVALDPDGLLRQGDRAARRALGTVWAAIPVAFALLAGSLAMPYRRRRRMLLALGWLALATGALVAIGLGIAA